MNAISEKLIEQFHSLGFVLNDRDVIKSETFLRKGFEVSIKYNYAQYEIYVSVGDYRLRTILNDEERFKGAPITDRIDTVLVDAFKSLMEQ